MAMNPRDFPLSRDEVSAWLAEYRASIKVDKIQPDAALRGFLEAKVKGLNLTTEMVSTVAHDDLGDRTHIVDMILMDLVSYGY